MFFCDFYYDLLKREGNEYMVFERFKSFFKYFRIYYLIMILDLKFGFLKGFICCVY